MRPLGRRNLLTKTTVRVVGHYEVEETPFGRSYKWHPSYVHLQCYCGAELTLSGASATPACSRCGADHSGVIDEIQKREERLGHEVTHPWGYDTQEQADQRHKDEAAHSEDSSWRYNDITSRGVEDERNVQ
jgi:hypothetical protein